MTRIYIHNQSVAPSVRRTRHYRRKIITYALYLIVSLALLSIGVNYAKSKLPMIATGTLSWLPHINLPIKEIRITGNQQLSETEVKKAAAIPENGEILALDLAAIKHSLQENGWVERAEVRRILPNTLTITIHESIPGVVWWHNKEAFLVSRQGKIIDKIGNIKEYKSYLMMFGRNAPKEYTKIYDMLYRSSFFSDILSISWVGNRRWDVYLSKQVIIKLPEQVDEKVVQLAGQLLEETRQKAPIASLDLRLFPEKIFIKYDAEAKK